MKQKQKIPFFLQIKIIWPFGEKRGNHLMLITSGSHRGQIGAKFGLFTSRNVNFLFEKIFMMFFLIFFFYLAFFPKKRENRAKIKNHLAFFEFYFYHVFYLVKASRYCSRMVFSYLLKSFIIFVMCFIINSICG